MSKKRLMNSSALSVIVRYRVLNILSRHREPEPAVTILTPDARSCDICQSPIALAMTACGELPDGAQRHSRSDVDAQALRHAGGIRRGDDHRHQAPATSRRTSIKYQLTIAKLPLAKDIDEFDFTGTPVNEAMIRNLASDAFLAEQRNAVLIGGTGTGKRSSLSTPRCRSFSPTSGREGEGCAGIEEGESATRMLDGGKPPAPAGAADPIRWRDFR